MPLLLLVFSRQMATSLGKLLAKICVIVQHHTLPLQGLFRIPLPKATAVAGALVAAECLLQLEKLT